MSADIHPIHPRRMRARGELEALATRWLKWLQHEGKSSNTINSYRSDIAQLIGFFQDMGISQIQHLDRGMVEQYIAALREVENNKPATVDRKLKSLRSLVRYAKAHSIVENHWIEDLHVHVPHDPTIAMPHDVLERLIDSIDVRSWIGARDFCFFQMQFDCAMRVSDLLSVDIDNPSEPAQHTIRGNTVFHRVKGGRTDVSAITHNKTREALDRWLKLRSKLERAPAHGPLFITARGRRVSRVAIHQRLQVHAKKAGVVGATTHSFKHARATDVHAQTGDIRLTQLLCNHRHGSTTLNHYGHLDKAVMLRQLQERAPLGGVQ